MVVAIGEYMAPGMDICHIFTAFREERTRQLREGHFRADNWHPVPRPLGYY